MLTTLSEWAIQLAESAMLWQRSAYMCSAQSHAYLYVLIACWILISAGGVYAWLHFIKSKPKQRAAHSRPPFSPLVTSKPQP